MTNHAQITFFAKPLVRKSRSSFAKNKSRTNHAKSRETQTRWSGNHAPNHGNHAAGNHETHPLFRGGVSVTVSSARAIPPLGISSNPQTRKETTRMTAPTKEQNTLEGKFFHTTDKCSHGRQIAIWQGHVMGALPDGILLIETFEWLMGEPYGQEFITLADFMDRNPILYENAEEMSFSYRHGRLSHSHRCESRDL
jgi:hypothetical protein